MRFIHYFTGFFCIFRIKKIRKTYEARRGGVRRCSTQQAGQGSTLSDRRQSFNKIRHRTALTYGFNFRLLIMVILGFKMKNLLLLIPIIAIFCNYGGLTWFKPSNTLAKNWYLMVGWWLVPFLPRLNTRRYQYWIYEHPWGAFIGGIWESSWE